MSRCHHGTFALLLLVMALASCAAHQPAPLEIEAPGFWLGLWHGMASPVTFIISLFRDIRIYAFPNAGRWYDFGFLLGISVWGGGGASAAGRRGT